MSFSAESPPAGWYTDPAGSGGERYWDGGNWSQVTRPAGGLGYDQAPQQSQPTQYGATSYGQAPGAQGTYAQTPQAETPYAQGQYGPGVMRQPVLAGFWWRVLASILDNFIVVVPFGLIIFVVAPGPVAELGDWWNALYESALRGLPDQPPPPDSALLLLSLVFGVLEFIYRTVLVTLKGGTLGQLIVGLRVLRDGTQLGTNPTWGVSALRALGAVAIQRIPIPFVALIDPLSMLFSAKKQTLHDRLASTVVIKK